MPTDGPGAEVGRGALASAEATAPTRSSLTARRDPRGRIRVTRTCHDAIVLAAAGLRRLGLAADRELVVLGIDVSIPAVGQGAMNDPARDPVPAAQAG